MSRIRSVNTKPEIIVRSLLHRMGFRFRLHKKNLPGTPDIVLLKYKSVVFVHGCFWHHHKGCKYGYTPKSNQEFWLSKFKANANKDYNVRQELTKIGWKILVVWECELKDIKLVENKINLFFNDISQNEDSAKGTEEND